ncbi:MAG: TPM domain-containing protein [Burkholderiales bacterium]|nr:TPM domain-containing protein [Burkholderiales bacterium]
MKKILFLILFFVLFFGVQNCLAFNVPDKPNKFVNDYTKTFSEGDKDILEVKISNFEKESTNEIAIVLIPSLDGDTIENVAQEIFTKWGIGKKDKNNGVLMLIAMEEHKTRIHTGYGVEGALTDIGTSYIQSDIMSPAFREGKYFAGIDGALDKIIESLKGENIVPEGYEEATTAKTIKKNFEIFFVLGFIILQWLVAILRRSKSWWAGGVLGGVAGIVIWLFASLSIILSGIIFIFLVIFGLGLDYFVSKTYQKAKDSGNHFPWWIGGGGFGGGNSSGSGFGGFGGGMSGGGGSSSSW